VCAARASRGFPPPVRKSFFERLHGLGVLFVGLRTSAHMREAQVFECAMLESIDAIVATVAVLASQPAFAIADECHRVAISELSSSRLMDTNRTKPEVHVVVAHYMHFRLSF
jgi:hypothetical protein